VFLCFVSLRPMSCMSVVANVLRFSLNFIFLLNHCHFINTHP